jgi:hypothetical protein
MQDNYLVVSNKDPMMIESFEQVIAEIEGSLFNMRFLSSETNFDDPDQKKRFKDNVVHLKRFYERAERLALNEQTNTPGTNGSLDAKAPKKNVKVLKKR